jgi:hypothetical protein
LGHGEYGVGQGRVDESPCTFYVRQLIRQPSDVVRVGEDVQIAGEQVDRHGDFCHVVDGWIVLKCGHPQKQSELFQTWL